MELRPSPTLAESIAAVQAWWRDAGVDLAFHDEPQGWLAEETGPEAPAAIAAAMASAASMPLFIAVCVPLIRGTLTNPAAQPISAPPGNASFGTLCQPPSLIARAP